MFVGGWMLSGGKKKEPQSSGPPMNASSKDEENFIQCVTHALELRKRQLW